MPKYHVWNDNLALAASARTLGAFSEKDAAAIFLGAPASPSPLLPGRADTPACYVQLDSGSNQADFNGPSTKFWHATATIPR
jgi:hypothetical protein